MNNQNDLIFSLYKPFRNQIRKYNLIDSLYLIWGYSRNYTFDLPFPSDIEMLSDFSPNIELNARRYYGLPEYELEFLLKEFIINCDRNPTKYTLRQKDNLIKLVKYLRFSFSDEIYKHFSQNDVILEFNRLTHRQLKWQVGNSLNEIFRYYKVYSDKEVSLIIQNRFNLTTYELFIIGLSLFRWTAENFITNMPFLSEISLISNEMIEIFFQKFSITIDEVREQLKENQQMNANIFYSYNPFLAKPILIFQNTFMCPIQLFLFWKITGGIYYLILNEKGFENAFGNSFQNYIGEVLNKNYNNSNIKILPEKKYGKEEKRTTDWILVDEDAVLFIECKTKRMTMDSKSELDIKKGLENDLKKMASFITQLYKTYIDYTNGKYPHLVYDISKKFVPLVVTLESWYINFNLPIMEILKGLVIENLRENDIDVSLVDKFPYHIRSSEDFEKDIQIIYSLGILSYFDKVVKNELLDYIKDFKYINTFESEFKETFMYPLRNSK